MRCSDDQLSTHESIANGIHEDFFLLVQHHLPYSTSLCAHLPGLFSNTFTLPCFSSTSTEWQRRVTRKELQYVKGCGSGLVRGSMSTKSRSKIKLAAILKTIGNAKKTFFELTSNLATILFSPKVERALKTRSSVSLDRSTAAQEQPSRRYFRIYKCSSNKLVPASNETLHSKPVLDGTLQLLLTDAFYKAC